MTLLIHRIFLLEGNFCAECGVVLSTSGCQILLKKEIVYVIVFEKRRVLDSCACVKFSVLC